MREICPDHGHARPNSHRADLLFGALFRLGIWVGDLEVWYGTKPLAAPAKELRATPVATVATSSENSAG